MFEFQCPRCWLIEQKCSEMKAIAGNLLEGECAQCASRSRPIRIADAAQKLAVQPLELRTLVVDLISSAESNEYLFCVGCPSAYPRWELAGLGRTEEYPIEFPLLSADNSSMRILIRHGIIRKYGREECQLEKQPIDAAIVANPVFDSVNTRLARLCLEYRGMEGHERARRFVFGKYFYLPGKEAEYGLIAIVQMPSR